LAAHDNGKLWTFTLGGIQIKQRSHVTREGYSDWLSACGGGLHWAVQRILYLQALLAMQRIV
jgi:hypothetical protein